ncbi:MAG: hypothetical protein ACNI25_04365 [Halarcobacter sp.]
MEIQSTTQTTYTQNSQSTKSSEVLKLSFKVEPNKELDPLSISFEEYNKLTKEDIEIIYQNEPKPQDDKLNALSLHQQANWTDDSVLNKILFDNKVNELKHGGDKSLMTFHAIAIAGMPDIKSFIIDPDNFAVTPEQVKNSPFLQEIMSKRDGIKTKSPEPTINIRDSKELVEYFRNFESFFEKHIREGWTGAIDENKIFENVEDILTRYDKKIEENNAILNSHTKNTKPNPFEEKL